MTITSFNIASRPGTVAPSITTTPLLYQGLWDATANDPTLISEQGVAGEFYMVSNGGATPLDGESLWNTGDLAVFLGTWQRVRGPIITSADLPSITLPASDISGLDPAATTGDATTLGGTAAALYALLASPAFLGIPTAPTAAANTNTEQLANCAMVQAAIAAAPAGTFNNAANGSATIPLGGKNLIIQWGTGVSSGSSASNGAITFSTPFPNACLLVAAGGVTAAASGVTAQVNPGWTANGATVGVIGSFSVFANGLSFWWIAIGW